MDTQPHYKRLVVIRIEARDGTASGASIPGGPKETRGEVAGVSGVPNLEDGHLSLLDIALGDHIVYAKYTGSEIELAGEKYLILHEDEVLGVLHWAGEAVTESHQASFAALNQMHLSSPGMATGVLEC